MNEDLIGSIWINESIHVPSLWRDLPRGRDHEPFASEHINHGSGFLVLGTHSCDKKNGGYVHVLTFAGVLGFILKEWITDDYMKRIA